MTRWAAALLAVVASLTGQVAWTQVQPYPPTSLSSPITTAVTVGSGGSLAPAGTGSINATTTVPGAVSPSSNTFSPETICPNTVPGTTNVTTCVQGAINAANASGGGTVTLSAQTYYIPDGLQLKAGVRLVGQGCTTLFNFGAVAYVSGTRLLGNNTNPGVWANITPAASQPTSLPAIEAAWIQAAGVSGLCIDTVTYGVQFGARYQPGLGYDSKLDHLIVLNSSVWSYYSENGGENWYEWLYAYNITSGGGFYFGASTTNYNFGNNTYLHLLTYPTFGQRGIVFQAYAGAAFNDLNVFQLQDDNNSGSKTSQAATMANSATAIKLPAGQGVNYPVDMPVTVSATQNGFVAYQSYFVVPFMWTAALSAGATSGPISANWSATTGTYTVVFSDGETKSVTLTNGSAAVSWSGGLTANVNKSFTVTDVVQLANTQRGAPIAATGATAVNLDTYGWPLVELSGFSYQTDPYNAGTNNSLIQSSQFEGLDMEGTATCRILAQNAYLHLAVNYNGGALNQGTSYASDLCSRNVSGTWRFEQNMTYDGDHADQAWIALNAPLSTTATTAIIQRPPVGYFIDPTAGTLRFNMQDGHNGGNLPYTGCTFSSQLPQNLFTFTYPCVAIGQRTKYVTFTGGFTLDSTWTGSIIVAAANANDTFTLPSLDNNAPLQAQSSWAGAPYEIANGTAVNIKVAVQGTQYFNRQSGFTTYTISPGGSISIRAHWDNSASFWYVVASNGAAPNIALPGVSPGSGAPYQVSYQPGLITSITNTKSVYQKITKASTVDNIEGSASAFTTCTTNPVITMYECGTSTTCASPTTIGSATVTAAGQAFDGTVSNPAIAAGDYVAFAISAGACASLDISGAAQVHTN